MANLQKFGGAVRKFALVTLAATFTAVASTFSSYGQSVHHAIEKSKTQHTAVLNEAASNIVYRTAHPFPTDPKKDLNALQLNRIDLSNSSERRFYDALKSETNPNIRYFIVGDASGEEIVKKGLLINIDSKNVSVFFERKGNEKKVGVSNYQYVMCPSGADEKKLTTATGENAIALRRSPVSGIIDGYYFGNAIPRTIYEHVIDDEFANLVMRVESSTDKYYGTFVNGLPMLGRIEVALPILVNELYLHFKTNKDAIVWAGAFGYPLRVQEDNGEKKSVLSEQRKVSLLARLPGTGLLYNPQDLSAQDAYIVRNNIPSSIDILIVDKESNDVALRVVQKGNVDIGIMSAQYWYQTGAQPDMKTVVLTQDLEQIIEEGSMTTLPAGTVVAEGLANYIGIPVKKPYKMPVAKFYSSSTVWISSDADELMKLVSDSYVGEIGDKSGELNMLFGDTKVVVDVIKKTVGKPDPFFMLEPNNKLIKVEFGVNWTNPWIVAEEEMNRRGAYAMTYDFKTGKFNYHMNGSIPSARAVSMDRPSYTNVPKIIEK